MLHGLDYDDRVVHHNADGEDEAEKRKSVDGESQHGKEHEGAHQRNRNGEERDQGGAEALEKNENHEDHQGERLEEGNDDFPDSFADGFRGIERRHVVEAFGEFFLEGVHQLTRFGHGGQGVGSRPLIDGNNGRRFSVEAAFQVVGLGPEFYPRNVLDADKGTIRRCANDDVFEILEGVEASLGANGVGEFLAGGHRLCAYLAGRVDGVLCLDRVDDLGDGDPHTRQGIGIDPDAHGVFTRAVDVDLADAIELRHGIEDIDVGVVGQEERVIGVVRRIKRKERHRTGGGLTNRDAEIPDRRRQLRFGFGVAHLGEDLIGIWVGLHGKIDLENHDPVVRVGRIHVIHAFDAAHAFLDGRGHRFLDRHRVCAHVGCHDADLGRRNIRELRNREIECSNGSQNHHDDGDHHGNNGPMNKETGHQGDFGQLACEGVISGERFWLSPRRLFWEVFAVWSFFSSLPWETGFTFMPLLTF